MLVSVLMITYNHEKYIREALESVLMQQTDFSFELIICDDSSNDNTADAIDKTISYHPLINNIKFYRHEQNMGMMQNLIFALRKCSGRYIAICEGDDYWTDPLKLQKQVAVLDKEAQYAMVITNRKVTNEDGTAYDELYEKDYQKFIFTNADVIKGFVPGTQTIMFRNFSSLPDYLEAHPEFYYGDRYITYFCSLFGSIFLLQEITAVYRMNGEGVWSTFTPIQKLNKYTRFMNDFHKSLGIPSNEIINKFNSNAVRGSIRYCLKRPGLIFQNSYREMIRMPWKALGKMDRLKVLLTIFKS